MAFQLKDALAACGAALLLFAAGGGLAQDQAPDLAPTGSDAATAPSGVSLLAPSPPPRPPAQHAVQPSPAAPAPAPPAPPPGGRLAPGQPIPPAELEAFVDGLAAGAMSRDHIAGAAVAVVQNGQVVFKKGYGVDRTGPSRTVDPDRTLFRLGSITKTFTWIALMREIEAGHMRLDAPVNVYLPQKDQIPDQGFKKPILVRDLLTHSGGFEDRSYGQLIESNPDRIRPLDVYLHQERPRRVREPGGLPTYSNYGAGLAGEALTQVTGRTVQLLTESEIAGPLRLTRTTLREPYPRRADLPSPLDPGLADDISKGFRWTGTGFQARPFEYMTQIAPSSAGSSTAADMARYMLAILGDGTLDNGVIYSPAIAKDFRTTLLRQAPGVPGWDYGVMEYALPGGFHGFGHDGATLSFRSNLVTAPELGLGIFVAANTETAGAFAASLPAAIVQRFYAPPAPPAPEPSQWLKDNAPAFTGTYVTTARAYHGLEGFVDLLRAESQVRVTSDGMLITPGLNGADRWTPDAAASLDQPYVRFHQVDGPDALVFEIKDGRAKRWFAPSGVAAYEHAGPLTHAWLLGLLAAAAGAASIAALAGLFLRDRRDFRQSPMQGRADAAQISSSILWLAALACFGIWATGSADTARLAFNWPGAWLLIASACAFVAAIMTAISLVLLPTAWRGGRRLDSWTNWRKARFTVTTAVFVVFAVVLGMWGALEPWSS